GRLLLDDSVPLTDRNRRAVENSDARLVIKIFRAPIPFSFKGTREIREVIGLIVVLVLGKAAGAFVAAVVRDVPDVGARRDFSRGMLDAEASNTGLKMGDETFFLRTVRDDIDGSAGRFIAVGNGRSTARDLDTVDHAQWNLAE